MDIIALASGKWEKGENDRQTQRFINFLRWMESIVKLEAKDTATYRHIKLEWERMGRPLPKKGKFRV